VYLRSSELLLPNAYAAPMVYAMASALDVTESLELPPSPAEFARRVSPSWTKRPNLHGLTSVAGGAPSKPLKPFVTEDIKILLLENVNQTGRDALKSQGYQVTSLKSSLPEDELIEKIRWGNAICTCDLTSV